jgi:NAD(P)-dependent dehydrogenase (short-subunit alcohol dehydrogenase family)
MGRLNGKVAIITGAASGQGAVEARLFVKEGARVVATDVQFELLQEVVNGINREYGEGAIAARHDVADEAGWKQVLSLAIDSFGKVDVLINNAGMTGSQTPWDRITTDEWRRVMDVNSFGNFLGIRCVVPEMRKVGGGSIVNISSLAGINGIGGITPYTASKGATRTLTKGAAVRLAPERIRVNSVHPGYIVTPMIEGFLKKEEARKAIESSIPLPYLGRPEDVAYAVLFLASDEAAFITGAEFIIDGGQSVR